LSSHPNFDSTSRATPIVNRNPVVNFVRAVKQVEVAGDCGLRLPMPYVELQKMHDEADTWGFHVYDKGYYVEELPDGVMAAPPSTSRRSGHPVTRAALLVWWHPFRAADWSEFWPLSAGHRWWNSSG